MPLQLIPGQERSHNLRLRRTTEFHLGSEGLNTDRELTARSSFLAHTISPSRFACYDTPTDDDKDKNGGGGGGGNDSDKDKNKDKDLEKDKSKIVFTPEQEKAIQDRLNELAGRVREEEKTKAQKAADKQAQEQESEAQKKKGEFEALYNNEVKKVKELEGVNERFETLAKRTNAAIDAEVKDWPDSVKKLDPGAKDVLARIKYLEDTRDLAKELIAAKKAPQSEHGKGGSGAPGGGNRPAYVGRYAKPTLAQK